MNIGKTLYDRLGGLSRSLSHSLFHYGVIMAVMCLAPGVFAQDAGSDATADIEESDTFDFPVSPRETHSGRDASDELLQRVSLEPEAFVGKSVTLEDGRLVGEVLEVKRKLDNLYVYFIVDATVYFNTPTTYAIPVREVESVDGDTIVMELGEGMHVQGLTYYPDDYTAVENNFPEQALPAGEN